MAQTNLNPPVELMTAYKVVQEVEGKLVSVDSVPEQFRVHYEFEKDIVGPGMTPLFIYQDLKQAMDRVYMENYLKVYWIFRVHARKVSFVANALDIWHAPRKTSPELLIPSLSRFWGTYYKNLAHHQVVALDRPFGPNFVTLAANEWVAGSVQLVEPIWVVTYDRYSHDRNFATPCAEDLDRIGAPLWVNFHQLPGHDC